MNLNYKHTLINISLLYFIIGMTQLGYGNCSSDNVSCTEAQELSGIMDLESCLVSCNDNGESGLFSSSTEGCQTSPFETVWFTISPSSPHSRLDISLTSVDLKVPTISVYSGDCVDLDFMVCNMGYDGTVALRGVDLGVAQKIVIAISSMDGSLGEFELCHSLKENTNICNTNSQLEVTSTSLGSPHSGPFQKGEQVEFCYTVNGFENSGCNYLHAIVPLFGEGWDMTSFVDSGQPSIVTRELETQGNTNFTTENPICEGDPAGVWEWRRAGDLKYNLNSTNTLGLSYGSDVPAGWVFVNSFDPSCFIFTDACCTNPTDDPNLGYGDDDYPICGNGQTQKWSLCFTLTASRSETDSASDCHVGMKTLADGETGAFTYKDCIRDMVSYTNASVIKCDSPKISLSQNSVTTCAGSSFEVTLLSDRPDVRYFWVSDEDGRMYLSDTASTLTDQINDPGRYTYTIYGSNGCISEAITLEVEVIDDIEYSITQSPDKVCIGDEVKIEVLMEDGLKDAVTIIWDGETSQQSDPFTHLSNSGNVMIEVRMDDCQVQENHTVDTYIINEVTLSSDPNVCMNDKAALHASSTSADWTMRILTTEGEIMDLESQGPDLQVEYLIDKAMGFEVVSAIDENGCEMNVAGLWQVTPYPSIEVTAGADVEIGCDVENIMLEGSIISPNVSDYEISWSHLDNGVISDAHRMQLEISDPGTYEFSIMDLETGCVASDSVIVAVIDRPIGLEIEGPDNIILEAGERLSIQALVEIPDSEIQSIIWHHDGTLDCDDCLYVEANPGSNVTYELIVEDVYGCKESTTIEVTIRESSEQSEYIYIPNMLSPNDFENNKFRIHGDGNIDRINVLVIYNRWGNPIHEVYNVGADDSEAHWDGSFRGHIVDSGVYIYKVQLTLLDGTIITKSGDISLVR